MGMRGVHFALAEKQSQAVLAAQSDEALMEHIEGIEEAWDEDNLVETDKAWAGIHRRLTDGELLYDNGEYPLNHCICGGKQLHKGEDYTVAFVSAPQVKEVAIGLAAVSEAWMKQKYARLDNLEYTDKSDQDFEYIWNYFVNLRQFYMNAANANRAVIFTVDC